MRKLILIALVFAGCKNPNYCANHLDNNCNEGLVIDGHDDGSGGSDGQEAVDCTVMPCTTGVCDTDSKKCVECIENTTCGETSATPACYNNVCTTCEKHSDCPTSNTCLPDGTCALQSDVAYVNGTTGTTNGTCGKLTPCSSLNAALALSTKYIHVSNTVSEPVIVPLNAVKTIIGDRASTLSDQSPTNPITSKLTYTTGGGVILVTIGGTTTDIKFVDMAIIGTAANTTDAIYFSSSVTTPKLTLLRSLVDGVGGIGVDMLKGTLTLDRSTVSNNSGGGIDLIQANYTINNSFITHNIASSAMFGGISITGGTGTISFSTIAANLGATGVFGISCSGTSGAVSNTLVAANSTPQVDTGCTYNYSGIPTGTNTNNNIDVVANPPNLDTSYHLNSGSPMVDKADPAANLKIDWDGDARPFGTARDIGADERNAL